MLNYLRSLSEHYQVLYFTCVKDNIVPSKEVITLNKIEEGGNDEKYRESKSRRFS